MAGIYIHIPFCRTACFYCDFHFSVNRKNLPAMRDAIVRELIFFGKKGPEDFFRGEVIETLYFGGGTPSLLSAADLSMILETIRTNYNLSGDQEITLEANPENLDPEYSRQLKELGINRLSIGAQSFFGEHLQWMNRAHNATQAVSGIEAAERAGFEHIGVDLIYGFPGLTEAQWQSNLDHLNNFAIDHLSCYSLTVEERTPLKKLIDTGRYQAPDEDASVRHFKMLMDWAGPASWEHYEISNFCRSGHYSRHNSAYWQQKKYLGVGPSAHSYNLSERRWNIKDNRQYIESWEANKPSFESETLSRSDRVNDLILTTLRTRWGLNMAAASGLAGYDFEEDRSRIIFSLREAGLVEVKEGVLYLTRQGKFYADGIASELFDVQS